MSIEKIRGWCEISFILVVGSRDMVGGEGSQGVGGGESEGLSSGPPLGQKTK